MSCIDFGVLVQSKGKARIIGILNLHTKICTLDTDQFHPKIYFSLLTDQFHTTINS